MRESLVEGWTRYDIAQPGFPQDLQQYGAQLDGFFRDEFLPSIQSIVSMGILIIKYDFQTEWLQCIVSALLEAFEESRDLERLKSAYLAQQTKSLLWWRPGFELYVAIKTIAVFAVLRDKPRFLPMILQRLVVPLSIDHYNHSKTPILFWPFYAQMFLANELLQGRAVFVWHERISNFWGSYFGTYEKFLAASCELEFLLEFNSHLGTNSAKDPQLQQWIDATTPDVNMTYTPDLYVYRLDSTLPMAEHLYDAALSHQSGPSHWEILPMLFTAAFRGKTQDQRIVLYGQFLDRLKAWQGETRMQQFQRFPFMFDWPGRLKDAVEKYRTHVTAKK